MVDARDLKSLGSNTVRVQLPPSPPLLVDTECLAQYTRDVAQLGRVLDLGSRCHRFESCHPDHFIPCILARQLSWLEQSVHTRQVVGSTPTLATIYWTLSSVGQSFRLITGWSQVRVLQGPPLSIRRSTQVAEGSGLENRQVVQAAPGFESQLLRHYIARQSSLVARRAHNPEVVGSNPSLATNGSVAQQVEQRTENPCVASSILAGTTI